MKASTRSAPPRHHQAVLRLIQAKKYEAAETQLRQLLPKYPNAPTLHYLAGLAAAARYRYADAVRHLQRTVALDARHGAAWFELGLVHLTLCRYRPARHCLQNARALKYRAKESRRYLAQIERVARARDVTLSVCLIVKNEEKLLANCLRSVEAVADEVVVVDTGSTDGTVAIAEAFGAQVYHYTWHNDFAAARNFAKSKAAGDWILQIDADEELLPEDQFKVRELIHQGRCDGAFVALLCRSSSNFGENRPSLHYLVRLFRNLDHFRYINPVHEVLQYSGEVIPVDIRLVHHGYNLDEKQLREKRARNARILYEGLARDPENVMYHFYLSMLHLSNRDFDLCAKFARNVLQRVDPKKASQHHLYLMALNNLALTALEREQYDDAIRFCEQAFAANEHFLDPLYLHALALYRSGNPEAARERFLDFLDRFEREKKKPIFNLFISSAEAYVAPAEHLLGKIFRKSGNPAEARRRFARARELQPDLWPAHADLGYLLADLGEWQAAAESLEQALELLKARPGFDPNHPAWRQDFALLVKVYSTVLKQLLAGEASTTAVTSSRSAA